MVLPSTIWDKLQRPIIGLSPMDGVTDAPFRFICAKYGKPDLIFTEFTSVEGIRAGAERLLQDLRYDQQERPVIAQLFGADPSAFFVAAVVVSALGFDGIDINMGCPSKNVTEKGSGAALILDPERAGEIIRQTKAGNQAWANGLQLRELPLPSETITIIEQRCTSHRQLLPVSVKTRTGYHEPVTTSWINTLLEERPAAISLHGRTLRQLYSGLADWEEIGKAAQLCRAQAIPILGNGDIHSREEALTRIADYGLDGALIGRSAQGNPWVFSASDPSLSERLTVALEHAKLFAELFPPRAFVRMRKHLLDYCHGPHTKEWRTQLARVSSYEETKQIIESYLASQPLG